MAFHSLPGPQPLPGAIVLGRDARYSATDRRPLYVHIITFTENPSKGRRLPVPRPELLAEAGRRLDAAAGVLAHAALGHANPDEVLPALSGWSTKRRPS